MPRMNGKFASGSWGRLKPVIQDSLESIGLPSKGDLRLLELTAQQNYYTKIVERYMSFCSDAGRSDELLRRLGQMELNESDQLSVLVPNAALADATANLIAGGKQQLEVPSNTKTLSDILMALRRLREGIVASKRADHFAVQVYLFCIRLSIMAKQPESYYPAILHLLHRIHPQYSLNSLELHEVAGYLVLDAACRRGELAEAFLLRSKHKVQDPKIDAVLKAIVHDDYVMFRKVMVAVDGHKSKLIEFAESEIRTHTLKCFGKTYFSVDLVCLERIAGRGWEDLKKEDGVGWDLEEGKVLIRKVKGR